MLWRGPGVAGGAASGAAGAMVASHNKGGQYVRARTTPTNPRSAFQTDVRNSLTNLASAWSSSLTQNQREAWDIYATNVSRFNRLGDSIHISGIAWFVACNTPRLQAGLSRVNDAPVNFDQGDIGTTPNALFAAGGSSATITLNPADNWNGTNGSNNNMLLYASRPQNEGINFFNGPYRLAAVISNRTTSSVIVTLPFAAGPADSSIFFAFRISRGDGRLSGRATFLGTAS